MKFIRWILSSQRRSDAKWRCVGLENEYSFLLAGSDKPKIKRHEDSLNAARRYCDQLSWSKMKEPKNG
jgi:hypothetical protein